MNLKLFIKKIISRDIDFDFVKNKLNKIQINQVTEFNDKLRNQNLNNLDDLSLSVFSQFNEDAIIQFLVKNLNIKNESFVEFGVENYEEANTRLLLEKDNWSGLVIDSSENNINYIKSQNYFWRHNLTALSHFISAENINEILKENNLKGEIGVLSIDTDGNDFWIWKEISQIKPVILVIEYNAKLGSEKSLSIKYNSNFRRASSGLDKLIYGASLKALEKISEEKGYSLVCTNKNGNNAFFVIDDYLNQKIYKQSTQKCFNISSFREYLDQSDLKYIDDKSIFNFLINSGKFVEV